MVLLTPAERDDVRRAMVRAIQAGLDGKDSSIKALDAHLPPPTETHGRALVIDIGGTNMRAAVVNIAGTQATIERGPVAATVEFREVEATSEEFFRAQAALAASLDPAAGLPVGYCFSYPSEVLSSLDARLIRWTKGIDVSGVEGSLVGDGLRRALDSVGLRPASVHVLNDTVASLLGGALGDPTPRAVIGLIAGTGSNMAAFFGPEHGTKIAQAGHQDAVAINLESGNFDPPHRSEADERVDRESQDPGAQRFEKAVAGHYLPYVYRALGKEIDVELGSGELVRRRDELADECAAAVLERSARLVATGLVAVATVQGQDAITVLAEGSLFWRDPAFRPTVEDELVRQLGARSFRIRRRQDANLIGAALAGLVNLGG